MQRRWLYYHQMSSLPTVLRPWSRCCRLAHLQVMIAILGVMAGVLLALAWEYLA
jgi:hypothetical protein